MSQKCIIKEVILQGFFPHSAETGNNKQDQVLRKSGISIRFSTNHRAAKSQFSFSAGENFYQ